MPTILDPQCRPSLRILSACLIRRDNHRPLPCRSRLDHLSIPATRWCPPPTSARAVAALRRPSSCVILRPQVKECCPVLHGLPRSPAWRHSTVTSPSLFGRNGKILASLLATWRVRRRAPRDRPRSLVAGWAKTSRMRSQRCLLRSEGRKQVGALARSEVHRHLTLDSTSECPCPQIQDVSIEITSTSHLMTPESARKGMMRCPP